MPETKPLTGIPPAHLLEEQESSSSSKAEQEDKEGLDLEKHGYTPNIFHCLFPVFGLAYHQQLRIVHNKKEHIVFFVLKLIVFTGFLTIILYTWAS